MNLNPTDAGEFIRIPERFRGPPQSGNGGYVAGSIAALFKTSDSIEVTLRSPIPLDTDLLVKRQGKSLSVVHGETLIAQAQASVLELDIPSPPSRESIEAVIHSSPSFLKGVNPFIPDGRGIHPICFCCGADHDEGLQIYAAPVPTSEQVAAVWETRIEWGDESGNLPIPFIWTALDCPGQFAYISEGVMTGMLGRITSQVSAKARAGDTFIVTGWCLTVEGKKHFAGTALFDLDQNLIASAKSVWIGRRENFFPT